MSVSPRPAEDRSTSASHPAVAPTLIGTFVALVYISTLSFGFVYDDNFQVVSNTWLAWGYVPKYFTHHVWSFAGISGFYWRPLFLMWFLVQRVAFGLNPTGWHAATVLLHVVTTLLLFVFAQRLTKDRPLAAIAALIFGVHPALIETVAWVSGSSDSLLAIFFLSAFIAFLNWRERGSTRWLAASVIFYACALMTKEPGIMLLPLVGAYASIYAEGSLGSRARSAWAAVLPFLPVTAIYAVIHLMVISRIDTTSPATTAVTILTAPALLLFYFRLLILPYPISPEYPLTLVRQASFTQFVLPCIVLIALAAAAILLTRKLLSQRRTDAANLVAFACVWIVLPLLPVLYIKTLMWQDFAHARYLYLPCMGFALLVALAIRHIPAGERQIAGLPSAQAATVTVLIIALACGCLVQQMYWASDLLLFSRGVSVAPEDPVGLSNLAMDLGKRKQYPEAIALFQRALRTDPEFTHALFGLGYTYLLLGRAADAEPLIEKAVRLRPADSDPDQWAYLGMAAMRLKDLTKAEWAVRNAIAKRPDVARYHHALALILEEQQRPAEAAAEFRATLQYDPSNADARARLQKLSP